VKRHCSNFVLRHGANSSATTFSKGTVIGQGVYGAFKHGTSRKAPTRREEKKEVTGMMLTTAPRENETAIDPLARGLYIMLFLD